MLQSDWSSVTSDIAMTLKMFQMTYMFSLDLIIDTAIQTATLIPNYQQMSLTTDFLDAKNSNKDGINLSSVT